MLDESGNVVTTQGAPTLGVSWDPDSGLSGVVLKDGRAPEGFEEVAIDKATADRIGYDVGDTIRVVLTDGQEDFTIVGLVGLGNSDGFVGATTVVWDPDSAGFWLDDEGTVDTIDIKVADDADATVVGDAIRQIIPERTEVVTGEQLADETKDQVGEIVSIFGTGLLVFALVTALVATFVINNIYNISISQRLRELALLRAVGASGGQIRRLVLSEAVIVSVIATLLGMLGGLLVAQGLIAAFNAAGGGFPPTPLVFKPRTAVIAAIVGVGVSVVSVLLPAIRAARIPPVAAMRPEVGFGALSLSQRLVRGFVLGGVGLALFLFGLFIRPGQRFAVGTAHWSRRDPDRVRRHHAELGHRPAREQDDRRSDRQDARHRRAVRSRQRCPHATPYGPHRLGADDRRHAHHRRRRVHVVAPRHVRSDPRTGHLVRLHRARLRVVPAADRRDLDPPRRDSRTLGSHAVPEHPRQRR